MRSDARRRAVRQGHTRSYICEKSLTPLARTAPEPGPSQDLEHQGKLAHGFTVIPHHDFKQQVCHANTERSSVCQRGALIGVGRTPPRPDAIARAQPAA
jgi:hypothetical protein